MSNPTTWDNMFEQLKEYKRKSGGLYGTVTPSRVDCKLFQWVDKQKGLYRSYKKGKKLSRFAIDKAKRLDNLGFHEIADENWLIMFKMLEHHKRKHGHLHVSTGKRKLRCWLDGQKRMYKRFLRGQLQTEKDFAYKIERIKLLDSIEFSNEIDRCKRGQRNTINDNSGGQEERCIEVKQGMYLAEKDDKGVNGEEYFNIQNIHDEHIPHYIEASAASKASKTIQYTEGSEDSNLPNNENHLSSRNELKSPLVGHSKRKNNDWCILPVIKVVQIDQHTKGKNGVIAPPVVLNDEDLEFLKTAEGIWM